MSQDKRRGTLSRRQVLRMLGASTLVGIAPQSVLAVEPGKRGGTLVIAGTSDIVPNTLMALPNVPLTKQIFNTLTRYEHGTLKPLPELATSWTIAPDRLSMTMRLREGVKFHTGRPFTADDVIWSVRKAQDPAYFPQQATVAKMIGDVTALSPTEVRLTLGEPINIDNLFDLFEVMFIIDHETLPTRTQQGSVKLIGTGPFVWGEWKPGESATLTRNPNYWKPNLPYLDGIRMVVQPRVPSIVSSLQSGQAHMAVRLVPSSVQSLKTDASIAMTFSDTPVQTWYVACNVKVAPLDKKQVRQAISSAIDRQRIMRLVFEGKGHPSALPWPPYSPAYDQALDAKFGYDPAKAKQLLAGLNPAELEVTIMNDASEPASTAMTQIIQYNLEQVGFKVKPVSITYNDLLGRLINGTFPGLWVNGNIFVQMNPAFLFTSALPMNANKNASNFDSDEYRRLAKDALYAAPARTKQAYDRMNNFLLDERFLINIGTSPAMVVHSKRLSGIKFDMLTWNLLEEASLAS